MVDVDSSITNHNISQFPENTSALTVKIKRVVMTLSFFFSSRRRHTRFDCDWSSDVCSSDLSTNTAFILFIAALACANVTRINAVFVELPGAFGIFGEQDVAVVVKIANDGRAAADVQHALLDFRYGGGGFGDVHRPTHDF